VTKEDALPQRPVRLDAEEGLAKGDEDGNVEDRVGCEVMKLQSIYKKQPPKKRVNGGRKAADEMIDETNPILHWRGWVALFAGEAQRLWLLADPQFLQEVDVLGGDFGSLPLSAPQICRIHL
jgi:hypothetical protein